MMAIPKDLLNLLKKKGLTLGSVESLTGGLFGSSLCSVPGASEVYLGGLITYDSKEKVALAKVDPKTIERYSVVSAEVAEQMARGGLEALGVDVCVAATGNAGPTVCPGGASVGTVFLAIARQGRVETIPLHLHGERNEIRAEVVEMMIDSLIAFLTASDCVGKESSPRPSKK